MHRTLFLALTCLSGISCMGAHVRDKVIKTASFEHNCPSKDISILTEDTSIWAYRLTVCGKERKYRDRGNEREWQFVDVTDQPATGTPESQTAVHK